MELAKGVMEVAAVRMSLEPVVVLRSSWRNARKLSLSFGEMALQPMPCLPGYSQLLKESVSEMRNE